MNITRKQRNIFWLIILMLVGIYYAPSVIMSFRRVAFIRQQVAQQQAAQQAAREAADAVWTRRNDCSMAGRLVPGRPDFA